MALLKRVDPYTPDSPVIDAQGRLRVSKAYTHLDLSFVDSSKSYAWESAVLGSGTVTRIAAGSANGASLQLLTTTGATDLAQFQTKLYSPYQPGKSQVILVTFTMGAATANNHKRVGYYDDSDGVYLERNDSTVQIVFLNNTSATTVTQANWNVDKLDGTGPSGKTLDLSKAQVLVINLLWLGTDGINIGFKIDGEIIIVHRFIHANVGTGVYMHRGSLPVRAINQNTGVATATNMYLHCMQVSSDGGFDPRGAAFGRSRGTAATAIASDTREPIMSIRLKSGFLKSLLEVVSISAMHDTNNRPFILELIYRGALTGDSWSDVDATNSAVEFDIAATAISGGVILFSQVVSASEAAAFVAEFKNAFPITAQHLSSSADIISLCATPLGGGANFWGAINCKEILS